MNSYFNLSASRGELHASVRAAVEAAYKSGTKLARYRFGFFRLSFESSRRKDGFTLNVWLPDMEREDLPHTHIFDLKSRILLGGITDTTWNVDEDAIGDYLLIEPECTETACTDRNLGKKIRITETQRNFYGPDQVYELKKGTWHSSDTGNRLTVTLMQKTNVDSVAQPLHLVPTDSKQVTHSFDFFDHDQKVAWVSVFHALEGL